MSGRIRVLIADDHAPTRADVRRALEDDPRFEVCAEAADAPEAIELALTERPDLCVVDLRMPGSGLGALWEITARLPETRVVVLTVSERDTDLFAALRGGASGYLSKSMDFSLLPGILARVSEGEAALSHERVTQLVEHYRGSDPRHRSVEETLDGVRLTSREWEVLRALDQGHSTAEIAGRLHLSESTVRVHVSSIIKKLDAEDREDAVRRYRAMETGPAPRGGPGGSAPGAAG